MVRRPLIGFRAFRMFRLPSQKASAFREAFGDLVPDELVLSGLFYAREWDLEGWNEATCPWCRPNGKQCSFHFRNNSIHSWGFHGFWEAQDAFDYVNAQLSQLAYRTRICADPAIDELIGAGAGSVVVGVVEIAGKVIIGEKGFRATHAKLLGLLGPNRHSIYQFVLGDGKAFWESIPWAEEHPPAVPTTAVPVNPSPEAIRKVADLLQRPQLGKL